MRSDFTRPNESELRSLRQSLPTTTTYRHPLSETVRAELAYDTHVRAPPSARYPACDDDRGIPAHREPSDAKHGYPQRPHTTGGPIESGHRSPTVFSQLYWASANAISASGDASTAGTRNEPGREAFACSDGGAKASPWIPGDQFRRDLERMARPEERGHEDAANEFRSDAGCGSSTQMRYGYNAVERSPGGSARGLRHAPRVLEVPARATNRSEVLKRRVMDGVVPYHAARGEQTTTGRVNRQRASREQMRLRLLRRVVELQEQQRWGSDTSRPSLWRCSRYIGHRLLRRHPISSCTSRACVVPPTFNMIEYDIEI